MKELEIQSIHEEATRAPQYMLLQVNPLPKRHYKLDPTWLQKHIPLSPWSPCTLLHSQAFAPHSSLCCTHIKVVAVHSRRNGYRSNGCPFKNSVYRYSKLNSEYSYLEAEASTFRSDYSESNSGCTKLNSEYSELNSEASEFSDDYSEIFRTQSYK